MKLKINSYSTKNRFALALKELGNAVRTTYLLEWIMDESLRRKVHNGTTKIERHHKFAKHLAFGSGGHLRSNNPADQEKAIVYNELVTNAVALQYVVGQTQALHMLKADGVSIRPADLAFLSPYATSKLKRFRTYPSRDANCWRTFSVFSVQAHDEKKEGDHGYAQARRWMAPAR